jgi:hypothetical protein
LRLPDLKGEPPFSQAAPDSNSWLQIIGVVAASGASEAPIAPKQ